MIITAALSWWNEPASALTRLVLSLEGVADRLVAVDGRWKLMPGWRRFSTEEEAEAIRTAAAAAGLELELDAEHPRAGRWTQIEKRNYLMRAAASGSDWVVVVDGDTYVQHADRAALEAALARTVCDVATYEVTNVGVGVRATWPRKRRLVYRAAAGVTVTVGHNGYMSEDGRWLNGDPDFVPLEPCEDVSAHLRVIHDISCRGRARRGQQRDYYAARAEAREDAWVAS